MSWQDIVIAVLQFGFALALIPSLRAPQKPAYATCILTAAGLTVIAFCFLTLDLWLSATGTGSAAVGWWLLVIQSQKGIVR